VVATKVGIIITITMNMVILTITPILILTTTARQMAMRLPFSPS
jgi:hypothetical protein